MVDVTDAYVTDNFYIFTFLIREPRCKYKITLTAQLEIQFNTPKRNSAAHI